MEGEREDGGEAGGVASLRASLLRAVADAIAERGLTQSEAARRIGVDQPSLSKALGGRLASLSLDRLVSWLEALGVAVELDTGDRIAMRALRDTQARLRLIQETSGVCLWERDVLTGRNYWSDGAYALYGRPRDLPPPDYDEWLGMLHPDDRARAREPRERETQDGKLYENELRVVRPDGEVRWMLNRGRADLDAAGRPVRFYGVNVDITERRRDEEHRQLLLGELNHRAKNTLAVVQAIAAQSFRDEPVSDAARRAFEGRLGALAAANDALIRAEWRSASLLELVQAATAAHCGGAGADRVEVDGPELVVPARAAVGFSLILHELCTNAAKYGALSNEEGRVALSWGLDGEGALVFAWTERGGPPVKPPERRGFGSRLIERLAQVDLGGRAELAYEPEGLRCVCVMPAAGASG
jgi:PAS domain S-box-containing protein